MNQLLCSFQETFFESKLEMYISSCRNVNCPRFATPLTPEMCNSCCFRQNPNKAEREGWELKFQAGGGEGPPRESQMIDYILANFCFKCGKYDCVNLTCTDCDCPAAKQPIKERMRILHFHCPLKLW